MKEIKTVALVGAGAIGSVVGMPVYKAVGYENFTLIVGPDRYDRYKRDGIVLNGVRYDPPLSGDRPAAAPADLVIVAVKATTLDDAIALIAPYVGPDTTIISLLNGITSEDRIAERYGRAPLLYSLWMGHTSMRTGNSSQQDGSYKVIFGDIPAPDKSPKIAKVEALARLFDRAGIPYEIAPDMQAALWYKFMVNVGCNQVTAYYRYTYGQLNDDPKALAMMRGLVDETAAIAAREGVAGADKMPDRAMRSLEGLNREDYSSMAQDVLAGRPTEVDTFAGEVCYRGERYGIPTPLNRLILNHFSK